MHILNVSALARQAGVSQDSVRNILLGGNVRSDTLRRLSRVLCVEEHLTEAYIVALYHGDWPLVHDISFRAYKKITGG